VTPRRILPMTYEEIVVAYRTNTRTDHSVRYAKLTPFDVLMQAEEYHSWHLEEFVGIRRKSKNGTTDVQIAGRFTGFASPEWVELGKNKSSWTFKRFHFMYKARVDEVLRGERAYWCLPGVDPHGVDVPPTPQLDAAKVLNEERDLRYREELDKNWHYRVGKLHKKANRRAAKEESDEEHLEEPDEYDEGGAEDGADDASPDAPEADDVPVEGEQEAHGMEE
jgi:hypothetical protein